MNKGFPKAKILLRLIQHAAFWILSFLILINVFAYQGEILKVDWIYTGMFHISLFFLVYVQTQIIIPRYLKPNKRGLFVLTSFLLIMVCVGVNLFVMNILSPGIFVEYFFISGLTLKETVSIMIIYSSISSLIKMSRSWTKLQEQENRLAQLEKANQVAELQSLKSKIQPHFMMNTLNNIYAQALEQDEKTPETVLQLANAMKYLLHKTDQQYVHLEEELDFLKQYISLEKIRTDYPDLISYNWEGNTEDKYVPPLLLLPLIENAFKHGKANKGVLIKGVVKEKAIQLIVENEKAKREQAFENKTEGFGLQNLKGRLELLFPKNHTLEIIDLSNTFKVTLIFPIKNKRTF